MALPEIRGKLITLRPWKQSDASELFRLANDRSIARFTRVPFPYKRSHAGQFIKKARADMRSGKEFCFAVVSGESGKLLGSVSLLRVNMHDRKAGAGYWIGREHRRQGFAREALKLLLGFAFREKKLNRVAMRCSTKNKASRRVIEGTGAKFEGIERDGVVSGLGEKHDMRLYAVLAREFGRKGI